MRDKKFVIDSIKMDLFRVVTATGDIRKEIPKKSVTEFLTHAYKDFDKITLSDRESYLKNNLKHLIDQLPSITDPFNRLRWTENILTIRCRL